MCHVGVSTSYTIVNMCTEVFLEYWSFLAASFNLESVFEAPDFCGQDLIVISSLSLKS
jgi:hypothetical protein